MDLPVETDNTPHRALVHRQMMKENRAVFLADRDTPLEGEINSQGTRTVQINRMGLMSEDLHQL